MSRFYLDNRPLSRFYLDKVTQFPCRETTLLQSVVATRPLTIRKSIAQASIISNFYFITPNRSFWANAFPHPRGDFETLKTVEIFPNKNVFCYVGLIVRFVCSLTSPIAHVKTKIAPRFEGR